jgi:hypothetical protein
MHEPAGSLRHVAGFPGLGLLRTLRPTPRSSADDAPSRRRLAGRQVADGNQGVVPSMLPVLDQILTSSRTVSGTSRLTLVA